MAASTNPTALTKITPSRRVLSAKENARKGGLAVARKYGPEFCEQRARKGGLALLARFGKEYYPFIVRLRNRAKGWKKGKSRKPKSVLLPGLGVEL